MERIRDTEYPYWQCEDDDAARVAQIPHRKAQPVCQSGNCEYLAERVFEKVYEKDHAVIQAQLASKKDSLFVSNVRVKMRNILTSRNGITYEQAQVLNKLFEMGIAETK